ncbi:MAG: zinc metalloprotease HtpX [Deltaproteobacteria bacterium]|nr:zinc metalloprotease HtpX [Deltaproteobacteria bacterium]
MKNQLKTIFLLGVLSAILIGFGGLLGPGYLYGFTALALILNVGAYFFSDRLVLRMSGAQEVTPEQAPALHRMVDELAHRAGIPKPRVCIIPEPHPNAFATGRNPEHGVVAVSEGIMRLLTERELRGVLAHELAHIKNRDILVSTIAATIAAAVGYLANALSFAAIFGGSNQDDEGEGSAGGGLLLALVTPFLAMLVQMGISRAREYMADEAGARIADDPEALASALAKLAQGAELMPMHEPQPATASLFIVNPLTGGGSLMNWLSTHPPMGERIRRLRAMSRQGQRVAA